MEPVSNCDFEKESYNALLAAYYCLNRSDDDGMAAAVAYWRIVQAHIDRISNDNPRFIVRHPKTLNRYDRQDPAVSISYETLITLAHGWIERISQFPQTNTLFSDIKLADAFIDNALPMKWDFDHDALIMYGYDPIVAEVLRKKNQRKFAFIVNDDFDTRSLSKAEEHIYTLYDFQQNPPERIVGNALVTIFMIIAENIDEKAREKVEDLVHQKQVFANTNLTRVEQETNNFVEKFACKKYGIITNAFMDGFKNKNVLLASAGPSLGADLNNILKHKDDFVICTVARSARTMFSHCIVPDIVFTVDDLENNIEFFKDLDFSETILISAMGTPSDITSLCFKDIFFVGSSEVLGYEMDDICGVQVLSGEGGSVSVQALSILMSFNPKSIIITGQDLVYQDGERFKSTTRAESDAQQYKHFGDDATRYTLPTQDGSQKYTSSDLKIFHTQIETIVALAGENSKFETHLVNTSTGGAVIAGFDHMSLSKFVEGYGGGQSKNTCKLCADLRAVTIKENIYGTYRQHRQKQMCEATAHLSELLKHLEMSGGRKAVPKGIQDQDNELRALQSTIPLLQRYLDTVSWRLRENAHESDEVVYMLRVEYYRKYLDFVLHWQKALKE
jgi:hypothetical protein